MIHLNVPLKSSEKFVNTIRNLFIHDNNKSKHNLELRQYEQTKIDLARKNDKET